MCVLCRGKERGKGFSQSPASHMIPTRYPPESDGEAGQPLKPTLMP